MPIAENIHSLNEQVKAKNCKLIAVTKTHPVEVIQEAYNAGQRDFGENKVQELLDKQPHLPDDIQWHLIGHLQRNKVKYIIPFIHLIHSVDSEKLLREIQKQAVKENKKINCLLQVHIAAEESKFGLSEEELFELLKSETLKKATNVQVTGLMGMATFTEDTAQIKKEFSFLKRLFDKLKTMELPENVIMQKLSMGMSSDYLLALEAGSTMVRVGSAIFGQRNYNKQE